MKKLVFLFFNAFFKTHLVFQGFYVNTSCNIVICKRFFVDFKLCLRAYYKTGDNEQFMSTQTTTNSFQKQKKTKRKKMVCFL